MAITSMLQAIITFAEDRASAKANGSPAPSVGRGIGMAIGLAVLVVFASLTQHQVSTIYDAAMRYISFSSPSFSGVQ